MNKSAQTTTTESAKPETPDLENVDKIRDILFGNQMREFDRKFTQLEKRLESDLATVRKDNVLQIESLQAFVKDEFENFSNKLNAEEKARVEEQDNLEDNHKKNVKQLENKIADIGKLLDKLSRETNEKILKQSQDFNKEMGNQFKETRDRMDSHKQELVIGKVDKLALSEMLTNLALQIGAEEASQE